MRDLFDSTFFKFLVGFTFVIVAGLFLLGLTNEYQNASASAGKSCQKGQVCTNI